MGWCEAIRNRETACAERDSALHPASKCTVLGHARALVHVACKVLCNKLRKLVSDEWSKRKSMWDGAGRFAIGRKRARSVRHSCVERARAGRTTGAWGGEKCWWCAKLFMMLFSALCIMLSRLSAGKRAWR